MSTTSMNIRTDIEIKKQAEEFFSEFGLNMTTAVNMFLRQVVRTQSIPLDLSLKPTVIGQSEGKYIHKGERKKDLNDLIGKINFLDNYDYIKLREDRQ
ncbi:MAG: type II toxin-antitoxin system RelB/DinJ family antitoxin [Defluviitaleaceae bacterium]|nr:type II toxin-antitoxin system RelB/DinJ family antitoxin [Defluviitaleaceae bacterium]